MKTLLKKIEPHIILYRDTETGLAWIENGKTGCRHSAHPNIHASGSVKGMKKLGYWGKDVRTVKCNGFIYNIDHVMCTDPLDEIVRNKCQCGGNHG